MYYTVTVVNLKKFIDYFAREDNWHNLDKGSGNLGYGWIHYGLIRVLKPERILCVGSRWGFVPAVCAMACKDNGKGMVDFIDAGFDQNDIHQKNHWGGVGWWKKCDPKKYFGKFDLDKYINLWVMTSRDFKITNNYGYVYLDGDHSYRGIRFDFRKFWPKLERDGFLGIHDIYTRDLGGLDYGVDRFWQEIKKKHLTMEFGGECGLGIIQKDGRKKIRI